MSNMVYRDWAKQFYLSTKNYQDTTRITQSKEVWNHVLSQYPRLSEFWTGTHDLRELTSIERSFLEYIIQSELQKPYRHPYYPEMEYTWPHWEFPDIECDDISTNCDPGMPGGPYIFDVESPSCFCPGTTRDFLIVGTYPIYALTITETDCGIATGVKILGGWGTSRLYGTIEACALEEGFITIEASMNAPDGTPGDSNVNIFECSDCCIELECASGNPETMGASDAVTLQWDGGSGLYNLEISGTDCWLDAGLSITSISNHPYSYVNVYTGPTACGALDLDITDADPACSSNTVTCSVRVTTGVWNGYSGCGCCADSGAYWVGAVLTLDYSPVCIQYDGFAFVRTCLNCEGCGCTGPGSYCSPVANEWCLTPPEGPDAAFCEGLSCYETWWSDGEDKCGVTANRACYTPCDPPSGTNSQITRCQGHSGAYPTYSLWECS